MTKVSNMIQKKSFKIMSACLALLLVISCITWNATKVHAQELNIKRANITTFANANGNAKILTSGAIGVFIKTTGNDITNDKFQGANVKWEYSSNGWKLADGEKQVLYKGENGDQTVAAYYPYRAGAIDDKSQMDISVSTVQTDATYLNEDLLYDSYSDGKLTNPVSFDFKHLLSQVIVTVTGNGAEVTNTDIQSVQIGKVYTSAKASLHQGSIVDGSFTNKNDITLCEVEANKTYKALVIPGEYTSIDVIITMKDGRVFKTTVSCPLISENGTETGFASGTQYNITLKVGQDIVTIGNITATDWTLYENTRHLETD